MMGGLEGFTLFNPRQIGQDASEPVVEVTELQVNNQVIQPDLPGPDGTDIITSANRSVVGTLPIQATDQLIYVAHTEGSGTVKRVTL